MAQGLNGIKDAFSYDVSVNEGSVIVSFNIGEHSVADTWVEIEVGE